MASRAETWWQGLDESARTVAAARAAVRMARLELVYLRLRANKLEDAWLVEHGISRADMLAEIDLAVRELGRVDRGLAALPSYAPASALKHPLRRTVVLELDPARRRALSDSTRVVVTPLIGWPGRILATLGEEEKARADQTWGRLVDDIRDSAAELVDPGAWSSSTLTAIAIGAGVLAVGAVSVAVIAVRR